MPRPSARLLASIATLALATPAIAEDLECDGVYGMQEFDFVKVPSGADCVLNGTKVDGNVQVEIDGSLVTKDARVGGNIQADGAAFIQVLAGTIVGGDLEIEKTSGVPASTGVNLVCGSRIKGNLKLVANRGAFSIGDAGCSEGNYVGGNIQLDDNDFEGPIEARFGASVAYNVIEGNLQLSDNWSEEGGLNVLRNRIFENLQCVDNDPAPVGGGNVVYGVAQEQCESLVGELTGRDPICKLAKKSDLKKGKAKKLKAVCASKR